MKATPTLEQRLTTAAEWRRKGANCAQAVVMAFPDIIKLPQDVALRLSIGFGGGVGGQGNVCGVISGLTLIEGLHTADSKAQVYRVVRLLSERFKSVAGSLLCSELKAPGKAMPCDELIKQGITIYHNYLTEE